MCDKLEISEKSNNQYVFKYLNKDSSIYIGYDSGEFTDYFRIGTALVPCSKIDDVIKFLKQLRQQLHLL